MSESSNNEVKAEHINTKNDKKSFLKDLVGNVNFKKLSNDFLNVLDKSIELSETYLKKLEKKLLIQETETHIKYQN